MSRGAFRAAFAALGAAVRICRGWAREGLGGKAMNGKALSALFSRVSIWMLASLVVLLCNAAPIRAQVASSIPVLETQDASVGQVIDSRNVDNLPLNGRNFTFLAQLAAGVNTPQADTRGNAASGAFSANGLRPAQNNYLLDGIDNNSDTVDFLNGTNYVVLPPVDAVEEFKVQTSDFSAEFGRSCPAAATPTIKSGTKPFHVPAWEFLR